MFGLLDPWNEYPELIERQKKDFLKDARNVIALLDQPVQQEGDVFAFAAQIYKAEMFYFQIWRPVPPNKDKRFRLIASRPVIPSVTEQFEHVRFTVFYFPVV